MMTAEIMNYKTGELTYTEANALVVALFEPPESRMTIFDADTGKELAYYGAKDMNAATEVLIAKGVEPDQIVWASIPRGEAPVENNAAPPPAETETETGAGQGEL